MNHRTGTREEWLQARTELLQREKAMTKLRDEIRAARQELPWVKIEKEYVFEGPDGPVTLAELFDGRSQLIVQHFMFDPKWQAGCPGCSFGADHVAGALPHLENHDVSYVAISRAPIEKIQAYHARMGWPFRWVSSANSDFNFDFGVSFTEESIAAGNTMYNFKPDVATPGEASGESSFYKDEQGNIYHTFSQYARGGEESLSTYMFLDVAPLGRNEEGDMMGWMRRHDEYPHQPKNWAPAPTGND